MADKYFHLHLISDSTGETVSSVARAALALFEGVEAEEHIWSLIRTRGQMERVVEGIRQYPGVVMYTLVDNELQDMLKMACAQQSIPCVPILSRVLRELTAYLGMENIARPGRQHELDEDYFSRVEALEYALKHDDGNCAWNLEEADIVLIGVSRTSKSPTCIYLAHRGYKAANVPFVKGCPLPDNLEQLKHPLVVGLTINPDSLFHIRRNRLASMNEQRETSYIDVEKITEEVKESRILYRRYGWPVIDVSRSSVEETAAKIIQLYQSRKAPEYQGAEK